jgi:pimeloyl-ACP methyl ester carboxylesterase
VSNGDGVFAPQEAPFARIFDIQVCPRRVPSCTAGFSKQPTADDFEIMLSFMMVPPKVRAGLGGRPLDATEIMSKQKLPVLVAHGAEDRNAKLAAAKYTASVIPGARLSIYEGKGHAPFYEDAPRFNAELAAFRAGGQQDQLIRP